MNGKHCPYGREKKEYGYTSRSKDFYSWINKKEEISAKFKESLKGARPRMVIVGDWVYMPYSLFNAFSNTVEFIHRDEFIHKDNFTAKNLLFLLKRRPEALFGGEIASYQKEEVPKIVTHLKEVFPDIYGEVIKLDPDLARHIPKSNIGRKALLKTLKPNVGHYVKKDYPEKWFWDGEYLSSNEDKILFPICRGDEYIIKIKPRDDASVVVTDDDQVIPGTTVFVE
ncbi:hypothetical protein [Bdellovibrio sp. BCCA]|uniref:hypothetical protein n=1 Tax=Bdellovibrio sp. BCCA TaxID=3136281 RepID=UPI0030F21C8F